MPTPKELLHIRQGYPLDFKIAMSQKRIREWYQYWGGEVYVAFSGGKDSTVVLHLVRSLYPDVPAVFFDTGLEYPEIKEFVRTISNVVVIKPKLSFREVVDKYGFPVVSRETAQRIYEARNTKSDKLRLARWFNKKQRVPLKWQYLIGTDIPISAFCCEIMKKRPAYKYEKETGQHPILGSRAAESSTRIQRYIKFGCNAFSASRPTSQPIAFWTNDDVITYLHSNNVPYSKIYDMGYERTGCMFCMFGVQTEPEGNTRFDRMRRTHPKIYKYCMDNLGLRPILETITKRRWDDGE